MPLPKPKSGEKKQDFISRCAGSDVMNKEFKDQKQKLAVCYSQAKEENDFAQKVDEVFAENSDAKGEMTKIGSSNKYDFYSGFDKGKNKPFHNIVPKGQKAPEGGYYEKEYIEKIKGEKFPK